MTVLFKLICLLFISLSFCITPAHGQLQKAAVEKVVNVDGEQRTYLLHMAPQQNGLLPLVVVLHGGGGKAAGMESICGMDRVADEHGFAVVYPQGFGGVFNDGGSDLADLGPRDDVKYIRALIKDVAQQAKIDQNKVFACGFSNGGAMSIRLALEASDAIKAVAVVGSELYIKQKDEHPSPAPIPMLFIHGTDDPCSPYKGGQTKGPNMGGQFQGRTHGVVLSNEDVLQYWCRANHCSTVPQKVTLPHITRDQTSTVYERFAGPNGKDVVAYIVNGGGHCWPGGAQYFPVSVIGKTSYDFSASEAIWRFFAAHGGTK